MSKIIHITKPFASLGDMQLMLRQIAQDLNKGKTTGQDWQILDEGQAPAAPRNEVLDQFTDELGMLVGDEDLTDDKLRDASENLLPSLYDALQNAGHGGERIIRPDSSENGAGQSEKGSNEETPVEPAKAPQEGAQSPAGAPGAPISEENFKGPIGTGGPVSRETDTTGGNKPGEIVL